MGVRSYGMAMVKIFELIHGGKDSVRVRSALMREISDNSELSALLPLNQREDDASNCRVQASVRIGENGQREGTLINGGITVHAYESIGSGGASGYPDYRCRLSFEKTDGTVFCKR